MSSSSSGDEADDPATKSPVKRKESDKTTRFQCPEDFVHVSHKPCSSTLTKSLKSNKNELWLIKAPASFNPKCFSGIKVPLSGLQNLRVPAAEGGAKTGSGQQIYSVLASTHGTADLCLLTGDKQSSDDMVFGPTFSGLLNVCESYAESSTNPASHVIPAAPAPSIPPGLKQRFHHFAWKPCTPTRVAESETDGAASGASSATLRPPVGKRLMEETWREEEEENEGRRKKKKKKEKRIKTEREEETSEASRVKVEPVADSKEDLVTDLSLQEGDISGKKKKKKKKKKNRDQEEVEEGMEPGLRVKVEEPE